MNKEAVSVLEKVSPCSPSLDGLPSRAHTPWVGLLFSTQHKLRNEKICAFTLAEVLLTIVIIGVITVLLMTSLKPQRMKDLPFVYSTYKNVVQANKDLVYLNEKNGKFGLSYPNQNDYCIQFADSVSTMGAIDCTPAATVNFKFSNGVAFGGFASDWSALTNIKGNSINYRDIDFDVNGTKGKNKAGEDQFQLRIYQFNGMASPIDNMDSTDIYKFKVISFPKKGGNFITKTIDSKDTNLFTFNQAACITGLADEIFSSLPSGCSALRDTDPDYGCPSYLNCRIDLVMPQGGTTSLL